MSDPDVQEKDPEPLTPDGLLKMMVDGHYSFYDKAEPDQEALPMLWAVDDKGKVNLIITTFGDETEKRMFCEILAPKMLSMLNSPMYGFTSEAWLSVGEGDKAPDVRPSKDPERREVIMSLVVTRQHGVVTDRVLEILRDPFTKKISLTPFKSLGSDSPEPAMMCGRMTELFTGGKNT